MNANSNPNPNPLMKDTAPNIDGFPSHTENEVITFAEIFNIIWAHKWLISTIAAASYLIAAIYAFTLIPIYQTSALFQLKDKDSSLSIDGFSRGSNDDRMISIEMRIMTSDAVLAAAIGELKQGHTVTPHYFPYIGAAIARLHNSEVLADPLFGLNDYAWGGEILELDYFDVLGESKGVSSKWKLTAGENQEYQLRSKNGDLVLSGKVGEMTSVDYQNSRVKIFVSRLLSHPGVWFEIRQVPAISSIESLKAALTASPGLGSEEDDDFGLINLSMEGPDPQAIANTVNVVARAYMEHNLTNQSKEIQQKLDFIDRQLPLLKTKLDAAQQTLQEFRQNKETVDLEFETQSALTQMNQYKNEISELQLKQEDLMRRFTASHPEVKVVSRQIESIQKKREETKMMLHIIPEKEWEFIQKTRDVNLATDLYVRLLNLVQELEISKAGVTESALIINPAKVSSLPVKPNRSTIRFTGLMTGLFLGLAWVFIIRLMHNRVTDPVKLENETGIHVYASIPHSSTELNIYSRIKNGETIKDGKISLLAFEDDTDVSIEAMRSFRTSMRFIMKTAENNVIIISGTGPSVGKSFFASNFAAVVAKGRKKVLLLDADMRKGHLHYYMGKTIKPGLSDLIVDDIDLGDTIHKATENFHFISSGERPPNPSELLESEAFQKLFEKMQKLYDLVVVDTPPVLAVTDASVIAQHSGKFFLVLRSDQHQMDEIYDAIFMLEKSGVTVSGLLLNDVKREARGYGYRYDYKS